MEESPNRGGGGGISENGSGKIDFEQRPAATAAGMIYLKTGGSNVKGPNHGSVGPSEPAIKINVSRGPNYHEITVPANSTFGNVKLILAQETGLEPHKQRLLFRGKDKRDDEYLHMVGVKDLSKLVLLEDTTNKERKLEDMKTDPMVSRALDAVSLIRLEVDKLSQKASALGAVVQGGTKVADQEFLVLIELLMMQLLKLDGIEAEGEAKMQRRSERDLMVFDTQAKKGDKVRRVQNTVENLDKLKAINANPFISGDSAVSVINQLETADSGVQNLCSPATAPSCTITHDWVKFD
ncbi:hypothetical protein ACLOJK_031668 [Asimina triloba]